MHQVLEHSEAGKPNFGGIIYGGWTHDVKAPADAVPVFLCAPVNDIFYPEESYDVYMAWREAKLPVELHYYSDSQHGFGATPTGKSSDMWIDEMGVCLDADSIIATLSKLVECQIPVFKTSSWPTAFQPGEVPHSN